MAVRHISDIKTEPVAAGTDTAIQVLIPADKGPHFAMRRFIMEPGGGMPNHTNTGEVPFEFLCMVPNETDTIAIME